MTQAPQLPPIELPTRPAWQDPIADPEAARDQLREVRSLTAGIKDHAESVVTLSQTRGRVILQLRRAGVTARSIGDACGVTEQTVFKLYRDAREVEAREQAAEQRAAKSQ